jgi:hypothetical protein
VGVPAAAGAGAVAGGIAVGLALRRRHNESALDHALHVAATSPIVHKETLRRLVRR